MSSASGTLGERMRRPMSRDKADTLLLLAACVLVLAPHAVHLPLWITLVCVLVLSWRGWITLRGNRLPSRWLLGPLAAATMFGVYWEYHRLLGKEPGVAMVVVLITFKLLEMRAKRDLFAVVFISFFVMLTNFFYSQSIGTALLMVIAVIAMLSAQLSFQYTGAVPPLLQRLRTGALILGLAVPLTLVFFLLFPRIQGPLWGMPGDAGGGRRGLAETMSPGMISDLALSDEIAFRAKFIDPPPAKSKLYWRGIVLGNFDGRTWTAMRVARRARQADSIAPRGTAIRHQVTLEPTGQRWLYALEMPESAPQIAESPSMLAPDMQMLTGQPINQRLRYEVASHVDFEWEAHASAAAMQIWLNLPPPFNPRTQAFASELRRRAGNDVQLINEVLLFFRNENFRYTLSPPLLGRDSVDEFLFGTRAGFCEHYAGAFVVLMRAAGIPARVVTGYQGGEINPVDGFMTVRQSDAHAWAEVWLQGRGWLRIDPTAAVAPERIEFDLRRVLPRRALGDLISLDIGPNSWLSALRLNLDAVTNTWNQWVLDYTPERQKSFVRSLGFDQVDWRLLTALTFAIGGTVLALAVVPLLIQRKKVDPVNALYADLCRAMARHGMPRAPHEGPRTYRDRLCSALSPLPGRKKSAAARFLQIYEAARYGSAAQSGAQSAIVSELKSLFAECR